MAAKFKELRYGNVVVRRATPADYQAVIDIDDNVYDGLDYVPTMYHQFLHSRHQLMLVIVDSGKVVGSMLIQL